MSETMSEQEQIARLTYERDQARGRVDALLHALVLTTRHSQAIAARYYEQHAGAEDMDAMTAEWKTVRVQLDDIALAVDSEKQAGEHAPKESDD
jgi:hypothetical protein